MRVTDYGVSLIGALALALLLATSHLLDAPDRRDEWAQAAELENAQAMAALQARIDRAAQKLCNAEHGPNSEARWTPDRELVCTVRRGVKPMQVAGGAL